MQTRSIRGDSPTRAMLRTRVNWGRAALVAIALLALVASLTLVAFRTTRDGALPRSELLIPAGEAIPVGGMSSAQLTTVVQDLAADTGDRLITVAHGSRETEASATELGFEIDVEATVEAVMSHGRQGNPLSALRDHLVAAVSAPRTPLVGQVEDDSWLDVTARLARELGLEPPLGQVTVAGDGQVQIELPPPSDVVDAEALRGSAVDALLGTSGTTRIEVRTRTLDPTVTDETRGLLEADAERAISAPVTLTTHVSDWTLDTDALRELLAVRLGSEDGDNGASVVIDPVRLADTLPFDPIALTTAPTDASFDVTGGVPQLVPSRSGFVFDIDIAATQVTELTTSVGPRSATLAGREIEPDLPSHVLADLGVEREVATFSTDHACCEGRVQNIQRIADLVDGSIVRPGESFSLNAAAGPRSTANGFVDGGAIESGEFIDQIGGGVSQFTTTLFNAVFFGGYEIEEFQPHSYYIPRYPLGREATLNFDPPIDFLFRNDSPNGILISSTYTDTSITVTLYSTIFAAVETTTSDRYGIREPEEEQRTTTDLPAGEQRVEQSGREGFSVDFTREITYVDGRRDDQTFTTVYRAQPRIVLVGTGDSDSVPSPEPESAPAPAPTPEADDGPADPTPVAPPEPVTAPGRPAATVEPVPDPGPVDVTPEPVPDQAEPPEPQQPGTAQPPDPAESPEPVDPTGPISPEAPNVAAPPA